MLARKDHGADRGRSGVEPTLAAAWEHRAVGAQEMRTKRLRLTQPVATDSAGVFAILGDPRTVEHNPSDRLEDRGEAGARRVGAAAVAHVARRHGDAAGDRHRLHAQPLLLAGGGVHAALLLDRLPRLRHREVAVEQPDLEVDREALAERPADDERARAAGQPLAGGVEVDDDEVRHASRVVAHAASVSLAGGVLAGAAALAGGPWPALGVGPGALVLLRAVRASTHTAAAMERGEHNASRLG